MTRTRTSSGDRETIDRIIGRNCIGGVNHKYGVKFDKAKAQVEFNSFLADSPLTDDEQVELACYFLAEVEDIESEEEGK